MAKEPVRKGARMTIRLKNGGTIMSRKSIALFDEKFKKWESTAAGTSLPKKSGSKNVLEWISKMGTIGRSKPDKPKQSIKAPVPKYLTLARAVGKEEPISEEEATAIEKLRDYLKSNAKNENSKINPANIPFNTIIDTETEGGEITPTAFTTYYGDYRSPEYVAYRNEKFNENLEEVPDYWYSTSPGEARPPVWQALFAENEGERPDFKNPSLLEICDEAQTEIEDEVFDTDPKNPLLFERQGSAKWRMDNIAPFRKWVEETVANTSEYKSRTGNYRNERAQNRLPLEEFKLSDSEAEAILSYMGDGIKVDLEKVYIRVPKRQLAIAATLASNYDENYKKVEKSIVSRKAIRKSQEKSPVSLSWKEMIKVRR